MRSRARTTITTALDRTVEVTATRESALEPTLQRVLFGIAVTLFLTTFGAYAVEVFETCSDVVFVRPVERRSSASRSR